VRNREIRKKKGKEKKENTLSPFLEPSPSLLVDE